MSKTYFSSSACIDGERCIEYDSLEVHGGNREGLLGDREGWCWRPHSYYKMTRADLISMLGGRGSVGWMGRTKDDLIRELKRLDEFVAEVGIKRAIETMRYKKTNLPDLYAEARRRGYPDTVKCRDDIEEWLCKKDLTALQSQRNRAILKAAKALHSGKIDQAEFNSRYAAANEMV